MKKFIISVLALVGAFAMMGVDAGATEVQIDDTLLSGSCFVDESGRTMAPVRAFAESMGCEVTWNGDTQLVTVTQDVKYEVYKDSKVSQEESKAYLELTIGDDKIYRNYGADIIQMDTQAKVVDGSTYVPLRFVAEALNCEVSWDSATSSVIVKTPKTRFGIKLCGRFALPYDSTIEGSYDKQTFSTLFSISKENDLVQSIGELKSILGQIYGDTIVENVASTVANDCWGRDDECSFSIGTAENEDLFVVYNSADSVMVEVN